MNASNEEIRLFLSDTLMGIKAVALQARKDFPKDGQNDAMALILHAARAGFELLNELLPDEDDDEDEPDAPAGEGKPPKLTVVD